MVYKNDLHSYKELPLRYSELGNVHRYEASGALNGLFRVRGFTQDDAHILLTEKQVGEEVAKILSLYDQIYSIFGLDYAIELSTRPEDNYIGEIEVWNVDNTVCLRKNSLCLLLISEASAQSWKSISYNDV